jgi:uncharacterized membrane protein YgdD (TMEM256/DUF423 family)
MNQKTTILLAALSGGLAVALGAFGEHALKSFLLEKGRAETFELAVRYQFYHTLALWLAGLLQSDYNSWQLRAAPIAFISGIVLFSGSLYAFCFTSIQLFVFVTPAGGLLFIMGWLLLVPGVLQSKQKGQP